MFMGSVWCEESACCSVWVESEVVCLSMYVFPVGLIVFLLLLCLCRCVLMLW